MSTRIFVKGIPPGFTEAGFRAHFEKQGELTDVRLIPHRRIGYIGYKTTEAAEAAVKYFNRSYIRMSKISVELAKSVSESQKLVPKTYERQATAPTGKQGQSATATSANSLKRKADASEENAQEPPNKKLQEFMEVMGASSKSNTWSNADHAASHATVPVVEATEEDDEYVDLVPLKTAPPPVVAPTPLPITQTTTTPMDTQDTDMQESNEEAKAPVSDADWLRSRTSRLLDLTDDVPAILTSNVQSTPAPVVASTPNVAVQPAPVPVQAVQPITVDEPKLSETEKAISTIEQSGRLFVRNLPYTATEDDIRLHFSTYGELQEVHLAVDSKSHNSKGFVYVLFQQPTDAVEAFKFLDGREFQGRLIHILPAAPKRENKLDEYAISKLPLKKQRELKRKAAASTNQISWNHLYMNADAVVSAVAQKLGVAKTDVLDPTNSDAAVKQALAEADTIAETKAFFAASGVDLKAFEQKERDDRIVLLKNFPHGTKPDELRKLISDFGTVRQFIMQPHGLLAIAEFESAAEGRAALKNLAYRRFKDGILYLEKGPKGLFTGFAPVLPPTSAGNTGVEAKISSLDLKDAPASDAASDNVTTLFVRNLSFNTNADGFTKAFQHLPGFMWARLKTKTDPKKPGQVLSMGFGFVGFKEPENAKYALGDMDGKSLDGHKLLVKMANRGADSGETTKKADEKKNKEAQGTKIVIKNLPFEVSKQDIRSLFGKYGTLRSVRMPKKIGNKTRGFAFAEFVTPREAANAMESLKETHLLGRRLVLDYAQQNSEDAEEEIEKMTKKAAKQSEMVALQRLKEKSKSKIVLDESGAVDDTMDQD
ncbi:hypothetical protein FPQ18DRAFT_356294 [Pyronema domesticum]|nr:hypothetical protein FPQ18DRAFT_356294 [Pyronema domesticum]